jgi:hypothetical protein
MMISTIRELLLVEAIPFEQAVSPERFQNLQLDLRTSRQEAIEFKNKMEIIKDENDLLIDRCRKFKEELIAKDSQTEQLRTPAGPDIIIEKVFCACKSVLLCITPSNCASDYEES